MYSFSSLARTCLSLLLIGLSVGLSAQAPVKFNFQAVARGIDNDILAEQTIAVRVSLLRGSDTGPASYTERHEVRTSEYGVFDLAVGTGEIISGSFDAVDWGAASYYLKIDLDPSGGSRYVNMGASQLLSVPYALYANSAGSGGGTEQGGDGVGPTEDPTDELQSLIYDPVSNTLTLTDGNSVVLSNGTDEQTLSLTGSTLNISNGNSVDLQPLLSTGGGKDEMQDISLNGRNLSISGGSTVTLPQDEPQKISLEGSTLTLSGNGGSVTLPAGGGSGVTQTLTFDPETRSLKISEGNEVYIPVEKDGDGDSENEIQVLKIVGNELELSNGGGSVTLPKDEPQKISLEGSTLTLSGNGGSVTLPAGGGSGVTQTLTFDPVTRSLQISEGNQVHIPVGNDGDGDSSNEIQQLKLSGNKLELTNGGGSVTLPTGEGSTANTDNQELTFNATNRELSIQGGNTVYIPAGKDDDADPKNELQKMTLDGTTLTLSQDGGTIELPGGVDTDDQTLTFDPVTRSLQISEGNQVHIPVGNDGDGDSENEIQMLKIVGNKLELSRGGGSVTLPTGEGSTANTDNQELSFDAGSRNLSIQGGNSVYIPVGKDDDSDPTNELQDISFDVNTNTLSISGGSSIVLPTGGSDADPDPANEIQVLTLKGDKLELSNGGGSVTLPSASVENTDNQELSFDPMKRQLSIEGGNVVYIPGLESNDDDPTNELQEIYLDGDKIVLTGGGGSITLPSGGMGEDGDSDATNELQTFTFEDGILTMSHDGGSFDVEGFVRPYITLMEEQMALVQELTDKAAMYEAIINEQIMRADNFEMTLNMLTDQAMMLQTVIEDQNLKAEEMKMALENLAAQNAALEARVSVLESN